MKPLASKVAVVAGATRGAGRGIAHMLGEAGATVYCTGRSTREHGATPGRPETIEETAELVTRAGGRGIPLRVDHTVEADVVSLFDFVRTESGRLDLLVNDVWGGDDLTEWGTRFWEADLGKGRRIIETAVWSHIVTARHALPLMIEQNSGLVIEITDGDFLGYRGAFFYDFAKASAIRLAYALAAELGGGFHGDSYQRWVTTIGRGNRRNLTGQSHHYADKSRNGSWKAARRAATLSPSPPPEGEGAR